MVARADILAGRAVILINIQDTIDKQLRTIRNKIRTFSNGLNEIGGDLFRGGIAGTVGSIFPIKEFVNFQDQMLFLQTKAQATEKQMRSLERVIRNLGMTTSFSSTEVAKGATMLAQAGFQPSAIEASLQAVLDLARGSRIELETSSTILSNILSAYQLDPGRASEVASKLIATARLGTLDVVDIGESMKELMTTARQLNLPLEDTLGMIAQISNMSLRATKAGTSLNAAWANLSAKSEQLAELGITITDSDLENPIQVFAKLSEALRRLPRQQQVQTLQSLFAIRGGRGFGAVLMQDLDELERKIRVIKTAGDEARISAEKLDSQLGGVGRRAISAFQELMLAIGGTSEGPLTVFGENLAKVFNNMSRLATANPKFVQGLLLIGPASLAAGAGLLTLTMIGGKLAMLITPLMMLNAAIFKTAAAIVGVNKRSLYGLYYAIARPYVTAMTAVDKYNQAVNKASEAQAAYMLGPSEKGLKKAQSAAKAAANMAKKLPFFMQENSVWQRQLSSAELLTKAYNKLGKATRAAYVPVMPRQGTNALLPRRLAEGNMPLTPLRLPLPILEPQFQLGRSAQLPILNNQVQNIFKQVTQGKQLTFGFEIQPNLPHRQLEVTNNFKSMADIIKEVTQAANELYKSPAFAEGMTDEQRRARAVRSALEVRGMPAQLSRQVRGGLDAALSKASFKSGPSLIQRMFDFQDVPEPPANIVQKMFAFEDVPKQMEKQFEIGRKKIIGRNASADVGFTNRFGTPNTMAARQAAADAQNEAIRLARQSQRIRPFAWIKPLINDIKLLLPSGKAVAGVFSGIGRAFRAAGRAIVSVNWLRVIITGAKGAWTALKGILTVLNGIRRFVFSLSGALLILEALIIFGDKIPGINQLLAGAGKALSSLFKDLGNTLANLNPSLQLVGRGIRDIFTGESERGISRLKVAFTDITNIIRTGWTSAWRNFMQNIEPAAQRLKIIFEGVLGILKVIVASIGAGLSTVFSSGGLLIKGDGTLLETIKSAFSTENIKAFFTGTIAFIGSIGQSLNIMLGELAKGLNSVKLAFVAMLKSLSWIPGSGASKALASLDDNASQRRKLEDEMTALRSMFNEDKVNQTSHALTDYQKQLRKAMMQVQDELDRLPASFGTIAYNVEANGEKLAEAIEAAIQGVQAAGQPATPQEYGPGNAAGIAAFQARMNLMADTFGASFFGQGANSLGGLLGRLVPGLGTPRMPRLQVPETGNFVGGGKGFNIPTEEAVRTEINNLIAGFKAAFLGIKPDLKEQEDQISSVASSVGKALVGDFASTRGSTLQVVPRLEKLQEKAIQVQEEIATNTGKLLDKPPMAFV